MTDQKNQPSLEAELEKELAQALGDESVMDLMDRAEAEEAAPVTPQPEEPEETVPTKGMRKGRVAAIHGDDVFVDLGGKDQGICNIQEFQEKPKIGDMMEFFEEAELKDEGLIKLNRRNAIAFAPNIQAAAPIGQNRILYQ